jgi:hypothetical protein
MDRYDDFLSKNLPYYLENELISEIIITDENGNDIEKIKNSFPNRNKLLLIQNETKLGPFLNKLKVCSYAKNEWIALIDSDNFADKNYFVVAKDYLENNITNQKNVILSPYKGKYPFKEKPDFDFSHLSGSIFKKGDFQKIRDTENQLFQYITWHPIYHNSEVFMNLGNYIINKYLIDHLDISAEMEYLNQSSSCDVIYMNTLLFEQLDLHMHIVPNLEYEHEVHDGSICKQTWEQFSDFNASIHSRYRKLI